MVLLHRRLISNIINFSRRLYCRTNKMIVPKEPLKRLLLSLLLLYIQPAVLRACYLFICSSAQLQIRQTPSNCLAVAGGKSDFFHGFTLQPNSLLRNLLFTFRCINCLTGGLLNNLICGKRQLSCMSLLPAFGVFT